MNGEKPREVSDEINFEKDPTRERPEEIRATLEEIQEELEKEEELSPEIIEKIMEKVQDINKNSTAFTWITDLILPPREYFKNKSLCAQLNLENEDDLAHDPNLRKKADLLFLAKTTKRLDSILKNGVIGGALQYKGQYDMIVNAKKWKNALNQDKQNFVHFNIMGRSLQFVSGKKPVVRTEMEYSMYMKQRGSTGIIFDISDFRELEPKFYKNNPAKKLKRNTFFVNDPIVSGIWNRIKEEAQDIKIGDERLRKLGKIDSSFKQERSDWKYYFDNGNPLPEEEYGFALSPRIQPKRFRGVVVNIYKDDPKQIIENIIKSMSSLKRLLPVYSTRGELLWPKQMSYGEVKKFVEERDKDKKDKKYK
ncbi:MAG: hypothetical protein A3C58_00030 [Candidatus Staskawiczbacteria bacterium RIFCSPHIGHO2_02_FULL_34_10]|uniref:Uncharacterized protein n=2 Tax=Candidatus Staskawicziibacteriota TaxID=1817916 RepID=A0A1G2HL60_9BACT|nr:MAG: hypothetical protein A2639_03305 [Candidatus Staskawiczbacteria bacterium RIFCSPHIGHO2_01_FULL_34_27]OGZ66618.1 MAG: hypothetical protein A3C58_00030 [Candidatus Staskawiczbacteria bacterium RIFCSPHIGHO2_02_FULL_34_10]